MNSNVYVFGRLGAGYTQYPNDYTNIIFDDLSSRTSGPSQMAIHREGDIMYYAYIRKLDKEQQYIGFCVVLNGVNFSFPTKLFGIFENAVADLVSRGEILEFEENGDVLSKVTNLYEKEFEVGYVVSVIKNAILDFGGGTFKLPPTDYGVAKDECQTFSVDDSNEKIVDSVCKYPYVFVLKDKNLNTPKLNGYKGVLSRLHKEKQSLIAQNKELQENFEKLQKQKKQFQMVVILGVAILGCCIGLLSLKHSLSSTESELSSALDTISVRDNELWYRNCQIDSLRVNIADVKEKLSREKVFRQEAEDSCTSLKDSLSLLNGVVLGSQPLLVRSTSFNWDSGRLTFEYYGFEEKNTAIQVRVYNSSVSKAVSGNITITKGWNSASIYVSSYLDSSEWHSFEILLGNKIVGGGRH